MLATSALSWKPGEAGASLGLQALVNAEPLFDSLPLTPYFVKDDGLRFVSVNAAMVELCGAATRDDLLQRTARDFFPDPVWTRYETLERQVMRTGKAVRDQLDLCIPVRGEPIWLLTGRWPAFSAEGEVVGVAGIGRILDTKRRRPLYMRLSTAVDYLHENFGARLDLSQLAAKVGVSPTRLKRDFVSVFGVPPRRYLTMIRLNAALDMLMRGFPIAEVAHACGFPDQSSFTHRFRDAVGMSPSDYRRARLSDALN